MKNTTRKITYGALIIACAVVLPQLFHLSGIPNSGAVFLPMHIPVLLGGFILGPWFGALVGVLWAALVYASFALFGKGEFTALAIVADFVFAMVIGGLSGVIAVNMRSK